MEAYAEYRIGVDMYRYVSPVLMVFGLIGNTLSFMVMIQRAKTPPPTNLFLAVLAVFDNLALLIPCLSTWLLQMGIANPRLDAGCGVYYFLWFGTSYVASYIIAAIALDRAIHVFFPFEAVKLCTVRRAVVAATIIVLSIGVNSHTLLGRYTKYVNEVPDHPDNTTASSSGEVAAFCAITSGYELWYKSIWPKIDLALYAIIPCVSLLVLNPLILIRASRERPGDQMSGEESVAANKRWRLQKRMNIILILLCVFFFIGTVPAAMLHTVQPYWERSDPKQAAIYFFLKSLVFQLMYLGNSINFVIYLATANKFRGDLKRLGQRFIQIVTHNKVNPM